MINRDKVVFINLTEMDKYDGLEGANKGGGAFVDEHGYGYEIFNFRDDGGKCYGYAPPYGKLNLQRISKEINHDAFGEYIDDVFVVFTCSREGKGRVICGFYQNARVYAENINDHRSTRKIEVAGKSDYAGYNITCRAEDAVLIDRRDRTKMLPHSSRNNGIGHGQKSVWYADTAERQNLKNELLDYVEALMNQADLNDEYKYRLYDESKRSVTST